MTFCWMFITMLLCLQFSYKICTVINTKFFLDGSSIYSIIVNCIVVVFISSGMYYLMFALWQKELNGLIKRLRTYFPIF